MKNNIFELCKLFIERFFRVRTLGTWLLNGGLGLLVILLGAGIAGRLDFRFGDFKLNVQGSTTESVPELITYIAFALAISLVLIGSMFMWRDERR